MGTRLNECYWFYTIIVATNALAAASVNVWLSAALRCVLAAAINSTVVAGENLTVGSTVWLPAESVAPGR